jgi:hypothetical protein
MTATVESVGFDPYDWEQQLDPYPIEGLRRAHTDNNRGFAAVPIRWKG